MVNFFGKKKIVKIFLTAQKIFIFHFIKKMKKTRGRNLVVSLRFEKLTNRTQIERTRSARARRFVRYFTKISSELFAIESLILIEFMKKPVIEKMRPSKTVEDTQYLFFPTYSTTSLLLGSTINS